MIRKFSLNLRKFQVFLIIVVLMDRVLFSGNLFSGNLASTPAPRKSSEEVTTPTRRSPRRPDVDAVPQPSVPPLSVPAGNSSRNLPRSTKTRDSSSGAGVRGGSQPALQTGAQKGQTGAQRGNSFELSFSSDSHPASPPGVSQDNLSTERPSPSEGHGGLDPQPSGNTLQDDSSVSSGEDVNLISSHSTMGAMLDTQLGGPEFQRRQEVRDFMYDLGDDELASSQSFLSAAKARWPQDDWPADKEEQSSSLEQTTAEGGSSEASSAPQPAPFSRPGSGSFGGSGSRPAAFGTPEDGPPRVNFGGDSRPASFSEPGRGSPGWRFGDSRTAPSSDTTQSSDTTEDDTSRVSSDARLTPSPWLSSAQLASFSMPDSGSFGGSGSQPAPFGMPEDGTPRVNFGVPGIAPSSGASGGGMPGSGSQPASFSTPGGSAPGVGSSVALQPASSSGASGGGMPGSGSSPFGSGSGVPGTSPFSIPGSAPRPAPSSGSSGASGGGLPDGESAGSHVNAELAFLTETANALFVNAITDRLTSVKGCLADPFIHIIYGHAHQNKVSGLGYDSHMGGCIMGLDDVWTFPNERYLRMGVAFGYAHGKTKFGGPVVSREKSARHNIYTVELFGAYEFFNDRYLKANIGVTVGYSRNDDRLHRTDLASNVFDAKVRSDNLFVGVEFVKNLYAYKDYQFGLWLRANYSHIAQKGYDESTTAAVGTQHVSSVNHDSFATVLGFNVEKEIIDQELIDKKLTLSLKTGWECQVTRTNSDATISFDNSVGIAKFAPTFRQPSRDAAIMSFGALRKLNIHWSVVGSYIARFNKDISMHNLSVGAEYSF